MRVWRWVRAVAVVAWFATPASGQVIQGRVLEEGSDRGVPQALVRLIGAGDRQQDASLSDSTGAFRLGAGRPGSYTIRVECLGCETFETPLLALGDAEGTYPLDLMVRAHPIELEGLTITADQRRAARRRITGLIGIDPVALRYRPLERAEIEEHMAKAHQIEHVVRWMPLTSIYVKQTTEGPCFQYRGRHCIETYLDGVMVSPILANEIPLDMLESIAVVMPGESIVYPAGAVLLFTEGWFRRQGG